MVSLLALVLGCAPEAEQLPEKDPVSLLTRISMDTRGIRPTIKELETIRSDPDQIDAMTQDFLQDDRFGDAVRRVFGDVLLTRTDYFDVNATDFGLDDEAGFLEAVGEEPLRILSTIAMEDRPYTEAVTGDWTISNEITADIWPLDYPVDGSGWMESHYTDSRPNLGILGTNAMWWRYGSTEGNANRGRANQISRIFLCNDFLLRAINFDRDVDLLDETAVTDALAANPGCVNCHASLDALASHLFGFWYVLDDSFAETSVYHPERERMWVEYQLPMPAYFGTPTTSLAGLGQEIAADPRFPTCAVTHVYRGLMNREPQVADLDARTLHRESFLSSGLLLRDLWASILADPEYRAADHPAADGTGAVPLKMVGPAQLASQIEALTGFRWIYQNFDMLGSDTWGVRMLAGGVDGYTVTRPTTSPNATLILVQERLAEAAASHVVNEDSAKDAEDRLLFTEIDFTETPGGAGEGDIALQLQRLHLMLFGTEIAIDGPEVTANLNLFTTLIAIQPSVHDAWIGVLSALLRDPALLFY